MAFHNIFLVNQLSQNNFEKIKLTQKWFPVLLVLKIISDAKIEFVFGKNNFFRMDARFKLVPGISHNLQVTSSKESGDVKGTGEKLFNMLLPGAEDLPLF